jgi:hypothetical protein
MDGVVHRVASRRVLARDRWVAGVYHDRRQARRAIWVFRAHGRDRERRARRARRDLCCKALNHPMLGCRRCRDSSLGGSRGALERRGGRCQVSCSNNNSCFSNSNSKEGLRVAGRGDMRLLCGIRDQNLFRDGWKILRVSHASITILTIAHSFIHSPTHSFTHSLAHSPSIRDVLVLWSFASQYSIMSSSFCITHSQPQRVTS